MLGEKGRGKEQKDKFLSVCLFINLRDRKKQVARPEATRSMESDTKLSVVLAGKGTVCFYSGSKNSSSELSKVT